MTTRLASHAGSWYDNDGEVLRQELHDWTNRASRNIEGIGEIPQPGARVIIAPHAGYAYSGPTAAWAYQSLDVSQTKRIFLLGPSHKWYFTGCALSKHTKYATPLGSLLLDMATITELRFTGKFEDMSTRVDENEHSLEMHLPYIYYTLARFPDLRLAPIVPILVGNTDASTEKAYGTLLSPYLADPSNLFVISSDFCHWGTRFEYTYYVPSSSPNVGQGRELSRRDAPTDPPINGSITRVDKAAMEAIETGNHDAFLANLRETRNTVCGRHPIGIIMAAIETLKQDGKLAKHKGLFRFVRYEHSSEVTNARDSSVSYASAFAVL